MAAPALLTPLPSCAGDTPKTLFLHFHTSRGFVAEFQESSLLQRFACVFHFVPLL